MLPSHPWPVGKLVPRNTAELEVLFTARLESLALN